MNTTRLGFSSMFLAEAAAWPALSPVSTRTMCPGTGLTRPGTGLRAHVPGQGPAIRPHRETD